MAETMEMARQTLLLTIREGSERYGYPQATLYEMAARGIPGFVRNGRNIRIHRSTFEHWLAQQAGGDGNYAA